MKIIIQRVKSSSVSVEGKVVSSISRGLNILVCIESDDDIKTIHRAAKKIPAYRIFQDDEGRMNQNILQVGGELLLVSQFTLSWNGKKGNRPSFDNSMDPSKANELFEELCLELSKEVAVKKGVFGATMEVAIVNDGPVTFSFDF